MVKGKFGIRAKIFLSVSLSVFIIFLIVSLVITSRVSNIVVKDQEELLMKNAENIKNEIRTRLAPIEKSLEQIQNNELVIKYIKDIKERGKEEESQYYETVNSFIKAPPSENEDIAFVYIAFTEANTLLESSGYQVDDSWDLNDREWYKELIESDKLVYTEPYFDDTEGIELLTVALPIKDNGKLIGAVCADITLNNIYSIVSDKTVGETGHAYLLSKNSNILYHFNDDVKGKNLDSLGEDYSNLKEVLSKENLVEPGVDKEKIAEENQYITYYPMDRTGWTVGFTIDEKEVIKEVYNVYIYFAIGIASTIIILGIVIFILSNKLMKPIKSLVDTFAYAQEGDFTVRAEVTTKDEFRDISEKFNSMLMILQGLIKEVITVSGDVIESSKITGEHINSLDSNIMDISAVTEELSASMEETSASAEMMNNTAGTMKETTDKLKSEVVTGIEISNKAIENAENAKEEFLKAKDNVNNQVDVSKTLLKEAMEEARAVEEINNLAMAITKITEQTNLLALNASIEAARSGEAGRGFAVVANEISKLADESKNAVIEIQTVTSKVISSVRKLSGSTEKFLEFVEEDIIKDYNDTIKTAEGYVEKTIEVQNVVNTLNNSTKELETSTENIVSSITEVTSATSEGARGSTKISQEVSGVVESSNNISEDAKKSQEQVNHLMKLLEKFKI